ncbi:MAG: hypothetical protein U9M98_03610 [Patescibacteria group bacterium]|nr:hypothetical protein [Patescibacteria group bacterium]
MSIVITKNGKNAVITESKSFGKESKLQEYIYENPESIPLYEIKEDIRLLILAREFNTTSGPIDAVGIDKEGEIYLIETKLYKNTDKRKVVAQVLDYGAALWAHFRNREDFLNELANHVTKDLNEPLHTRIRNFYGLSEEDTTTVLDTVGQNIIDGNYRFVVLMDALDNRLKDLILFVNQNSEFTIYAVELEYYKHEEFEIIIPKLFGSEVKKDIGKSRRHTKIPSDDEFITAYKGRSEQGKVKDLLALYNQLASGKCIIDQLEVKKTPKFVYFQFEFESENKVQFNLGIEPDYEGGGLQCWCSKELEQKIKKLIKDKFSNTEVLDDLQTSYGKVTKTPLSDYSTDKFKVLLENITYIEN